MRLLRFRPRPAMELCPASERESLRDRRRNVRFSKCRAPRFFHMYVLESRGRAILGMRRRTRWNERHRLPESAARLRRILWRGAGGLLVFLFRGCPRQGLRMRRKRREQGLAMHVRSSMWGQSAAYLCLLAGIVVPACGGNIEAHDGTSIQDAAPPELESSAPVRTCVHNAACPKTGDICRNDCGQPCQCLDSFNTGSPQWVCVRPMTGSRCNPAAQSTCSYLSPSGEEERCACESPEGEAFWNCGQAHSLCPEESPHGATCAPLPLGMRCGGCECVLRAVSADTDRVFRCDRDGGHTHQ